MNGTEYRTSVDECSLVPCSKLGKEIIITCKSKVPINNQGNHPPYLFD